MNKIPSPQVLISQAMIQKRVEEVARLLDQQYQGEELVLVAVMKGAVCIAADLLRALNTPTIFEWVQASSYGNKGSIRGDLHIEGYEKLDLASKHVLLVDDIFDSGHTLTQILFKLQEKQPRSLKSLVLLSKQVKRDHCYEPDHVLFSVENRFVIGWGLDYKEYYRGLPGIYTFESEPT